MKIDFKEEQRVTQWWLWLTLIAISIIPSFGIYKQLILGESFGNNPMSDTGLIVLAVFSLGLLVMIWLIRLKTKIDASEIQMNFFPFTKKQVKWTEVKNAEVIDYGFVGGWGIRFWTKYGTVYNIKGKHGLYIELLNGKKFLIGTQKETELKNVLEKITKNS